MLRVWAVRPQELQGLQENLLRFSKTRSNNERKELTKAR
jgi:hypothetical protein